jgi:hypothetical protein
MRVHAAPLERNEKQRGHGAIRRQAVATPTGPSPTHAPDSPGDVLRLQRLVGNHVTTSLLRRREDAGIVRREPGEGGRRRSGAVTDRTAPPVPPRPLRLAKPMPPKSLDEKMSDNGFTGSQDTRSYDQMLENVDLGKKRSKLTKKSSFVGLMADYTSLAQLRAAQIRKAADTLGYDYVSLQDLKGENQALKGGAPTTDKKVLEERGKLATAYKLVVGEYTTGKKPGTFANASPDFDVDWNKALADSAEWSQRSQKARDETEEERVNIELLWDQVNDDGFPEQDTGAKQAAEAKNSLNRIEVLRAQMKLRVDHLTEIKRVQGAGGKIVDAVGAGLMSFATTLATLGIVAVEKEFNPVFYKGAGWTYHADMPTGLFERRAGLLTAGGKVDKKSASSREKLPVEKREEEAYRVVVMENLGGKIDAVKRLLAQRAGGANGLDWLSSILWFIGDGILQSLMAVGSRIALWITGLSLLLHLINVPAHGALTPVIAVLTALALAITYVRMALAAVKVVISAARLAVDSLNAVLNKDPRMAQALKGRAIRSAVGLMGDSLQLGGFALVMGGDTIKEGLGMTNAFNPVSDIANVGQVHSDVLNGVGPSVLSGDFIGGTGVFLGGVVGVLGGADAVPAVGEAVSDTNDLNAYGSMPYLGGSNQKSQGRKWSPHEGGHQVGSGQPAGGGQQKWARSQPKARTPGWVQEGMDREEQKVGERAVYLKKDADKRVGASKGSMQTPITHLGDASDQTKKVTTLLDKVKAFFSGESKKKNPDVPKDEIGEQQAEADKNQASSKRFGLTLDDSVNTLKDFAA